MPELPEVETIARGLREGAQPPGVSVVGRQIAAAQVLWPKTIAAPSPQAFARRITGQTISEVGRRGKYLIFHLDRDKLLIHLRMSGDIVVRPAHEPPAPHDRVVLTLEGRVHLAFNDTRKFGRLWLLADPGPIFQKLGPEPFDPELTPQRFFQALHNRRRQLKPLLLDQSFLAGLGNIYTDEALHRAGLHPLTPAHTLTEAQAARLLAEIRQVLQDGIRSNGASIDWVYRGGGFQNQFRVYGRGGQPCPQCGATIERIVVGQRGTHFCPTCQPGTGW